MLTCTGTLDTRIIFVLLNCIPASRSKDVPASQKQLADVTGRKPLRDNTELHHQEVVLAEI